MKDLKSLEPLVAAKYQKAQARLAQIAAQEGRLKAQLSELHRSREQAVNRDGSDPASKSGADVRWQRWIDQRRKEINLELAQLASQRLVAKEGLKVAFGRKEALLSLIQARKNEDQLKARRKSDQLS